MNRVVLLTSLSLCVIVGRVDAQAGPFGCYWPTGPGYSWKSINNEPPFDTSFLDMLGPYEFGGHPDAVLLGPFGEPPDPVEFLIVVNDGVTFSMLGRLVDGVEVDFPDIDLGVFSDGDSFELQPGDFTVIRLWENLDHDLTDAYGVDPELTDVIVLVWYDTNFRANDQNPIVESGGGQTYRWGVTDIDFLQKNVGPMAFAGVGAKDGNLEGTYNVIASFDCNDNQVPDHTDIEDETSQDVDKNCIPDECHCVWDFDEDGSVGITDLLDLLAGWGSPYDITHLLSLLAAWGPCP